MPLPAPLFRAPRETIVQVAARHRAEVRQGERASVQRIEGLYRAVEEGLREDLRRAEATIAALAGQEVRESDLRRSSELATLLAQAKERADAFARQLAGDVREQNVASAKRGAGHADELLKLDVGTSLRSLNPAAVLEIAGSTAPGSPLRHLIDAIPGASVQGVERVLVSGIARGQNPNEIARRMRSEVGDLDVRRSTVIARNESLRAYTGAQSATYEENDDVVTGMEIHSALDARTCPLCWARHGTILEPGETLARHICCRCVLLPVTRYSKLGPNGPERFAKLSSVEQKRILGPGRYELYRDGLPLGSIYEERSGGLWGPQVSGRTLKDLRVLPKGELPLITQEARRPIKEALHTTLGATIRPSARQVRVGLDAAAKAYPEARIAPRAVSVQRSYIESGGHRAFGVHTSESIRIALVPDNPVALTTAHEVGHAILTDLVYPFRDLGNGPAIRELAEALDTPQRRRQIEAFVQGGTYTSEEAQYLLSQDELLARALGQFAAVTENAISARKLADQAALGEYWTVDEFELWREAMERFLSYNEVAMSHDRTLTADQIRMVQETGLSVEAVQIGWQGAKAYGDDSNPSWAHSRET